MPTKETVKDPLDILADFVSDVDGMGGLRLDDNSKHVIGLAEELDTRHWANLAITCKAAADALTAAGRPVKLRKKRVYIDDEVHVDENHDDDDE